MTANTAPVAVVTGANTGLDFETSLVLARKGFEVVLACRSENKALCERLWSLSEELLGVEFRI